MTLPELRALLERASPGPWRAYPPNTCVPGYDVCDRVVSDRWTHRSSGDGMSDDDAALICALRNETPALLDRLERLEQDAAWWKRQRDDALARVEEATAGFAKERATLNAQVEALQKKLTDAQEAKHRAIQQTAAVNARAERLERALDTITVAASREIAQAIARAALEGK